MSRILIVEDDEAVREMVVEVLLGAGHSVARAFDGEEALDHLHQHPADAILLDLIMPVMDGWRFLELVHQDLALASIPIGIMSAAPAARRAARQWGVDVILSKPFALDELLGQVERLLGG